MCLHVQWAYYPKHPGVVSPFSKKVSITHTQQKLKTIELAGCRRFTSLQHLRSYQEHQIMQPK